MYSQHLIFFLNGDSTSVTLQRALHYGLSVAPSVARQVIASSLFIVCLLELP